LNDLWKYDIETQHWTCIQESSGPASDNHDAAASAGQEVAAAPHGKIPTRRFGYVSVVHNGKFVLFGGFDVSFCCCCSLSLFFYLRTISIGIFNTVTVKHTGLTLAQ
jgi:hypothetical protein